MMRCFLPRLRPAGAAALVAALSLVAALAYAADPLVIDKDGTVTIGPSAAPLVIGKDSVRVGTNLNFGQRMAPLLTLWEPGYTVGIQGMTMYFRTDQNFAWYMGGYHGDGELDSGGGTLLMSLSSKPAAGKGTLDVNGALTAKSIAAESVTVNNNDLLALVNTLQAKIAALEKQTAALQADKISSTDGETLRVVRGTINGYNNSVIAGSGFILKRYSEGIYDINFNIPFKKIPSASVTQVFNGHNPPFPETNDDQLLKQTAGDLTDNAIIVFLTTQTIRIKTGHYHGAADRPFSFIVIGPQ